MLTDVRLNQVGMIQVGDEVSSERLDRVLVEHDSAGLEIEQVLQIRFERDDRVFVAFLKLKNPRRKLDLKYAALMLIIIIIFSLSHYRPNR